MRSRPERLQNAIASTSGPLDSESQEKAAERFGVIPFRRPRRRLLNGYLIRRKRARKSCLFVHFFWRTSPFTKLPVVRIILSMHIAGKIRLSALLLLCGLTAAAAFILGCSQKRLPESQADNPVISARRERDLAFKSSPQSPIPAQERARFQGLSYYPVEPALRFRLKLNRYPAPEHIRMATNTGEVRDGLRYGYFEFTVDGRACRLQAYRLDDDANSGPPSLFVPFRDATTGKETYAAGRYLDLPENVTGIYDLDFNKAYNPSCAYAEGFSCPVPPDENRLPVPIRAGEKIYPFAHNH